MFRDVSDLVYGLDELNETINIIFQTLSPNSFTSHQKLRAALFKHPWSKMMAAIDPCVLPGRSFAWNRAMGSHYDTRGPRFDWTPIVAVEAPEGAYVVFHSLKEVLFFETGSILFLRGSEISHSILGGAWQHVPGQRVTITHFSHESVWNAKDVKYDWDSDSFASVKKDLGVQTVVELGK